jgi:serine/threonine protein kinase
MESLPSIPGYAILHQLGGGPFTRVFAALEYRTGHRVVLKMPRLTGLTAETALTLLRREAAAGLAVRHPNLVRIRRQHTDWAPHYLVMDLLQGESLRARLEREPVVHPAWAIWITRQIAQALAALHRAGFVHGDVKPENIVLTGAKTAVLIDLGYAHRPGENASFIRSGLILGTANYLAPELCARTLDADGGADVFSLGVTLFEMLTGQLPYPRETPLRTVHAHLNTAPADLRDFPGPWPIGLPSLVRRMLARSRSNRPGADRLVSELIALEIQILTQQPA